MNTYITSAIALIMLCASQIVGANFVLASTETQIDLEPVYTSESFSVTSIDSATSTITIDTSSFSNNTLLSITLVQKIDEDFGDYGVVRVITDSTPNTGSHSFTLTPEEIGLNLFVIVDLALTDEEKVFVAEAMRGEILDAAYIEYSEESEDIYFAEPQEETEEII